MTRKFIILAAFITHIFFPVKSQSLYFPPLTGNTWDTISPSSLGWCTDYLDTLNSLLQNTNTKGFMLLKDGKIAYEKYYGTFTVDSLWYWASAGKTLTAFTVGVAQEKGFLSIADTTSKYLGTGWTNCPAVKEDLITVRHQLTMTSGLDDNVADSDCTIDSCLQYLANAGTRWAYHNAPYTLLQDVIHHATGNFTAFFVSNLRNRIGMDGLWLPSGYNSVYYSRVRSMARYGLLILNKGIWDADTLLHDTTYFNAMVSTSQNLNPSYGYLWWLNGKSSYMLPGLQFQFNGSIIPTAPSDMICALGKNDQKIHVVPSQNLVVIRMGNPAYNNQPVPVVLDNEIWEILNNVFCSTTSSGSLQSEKSGTGIFPNPASGKINFKTDVLQSGFLTVVYDAFGRSVIEKEMKPGEQLDVSLLDNGYYILKINTGSSVSAHRLIVKK